MEINATKKTRSIKCAKSPVSGSKMTCLISGLKQFSRVASIASMFFFGTFWPLAFGRTQLGFMAMNSIPCRPHSSF